MLRIGYNMVCREIRDWLGAEDIRFWDHASTQCMQYSVYAVRGVNSWSWHGDIESDDSTSFSQVMVALRTRKREMIGMGEIIMRNWVLREFCVRVNLPSPKRQVRVPIHRVITPTRGVPNQIRQVIPLSSHIRSYPPHHSHLHLPSLSFLSTTQPSSQNT